eukprot:3531146-Rhodomonas_salina.1
MDGGSGGAGGGGQWESRGVEGQGDLASCRSRTRSRRRGPGATGSAAWPARGCCALCRPRPSHASRTRGTASPLAPPGRPLGLTLSPAGAFRSPTPPALPAPARPS